jgi:hypothetical protein
MGKKKRGGGDRTGEGTWGLGREARRMGIWWRKTRLSARNETSVVAAVMVKMGYEKGYFRACRDGSLLPSLPPASSRSSFPY